MERQIITTADGSHTVEIPELGVTYHSRHGALQESRHVFIESGLRPALARFEGPVSVFEMGFGSGLNALLTAVAAGAAGRRIRYTAVEAFPLAPEKAAALNYGAALGEEGLFRQLHGAQPGEELQLTECFALLKHHIKLQDVPADKQFHLIYYDAFAPSAQPELWTEERFRQLYALLLPGGILTTYCSKGSVRRALQAAGFRVEKLAGPPGKREMVRAERQG